MTMLPRTGSPRLAWLAGLVLGLLDGFLLFEFPLLALALVAAAAILLTRQQPRSIGVGGLLVGIGGLWLAVLLRARLSCDAFNEVPGQSCEMPTVDGYLAVAVVVLLLGIVFSVAGLRRLRRP